jgi:hypothetical protein
MLLRDLFEDQTEMFPASVIKPSYSGNFNVMINGKVWKKEGNPVLFTTHNEALSAANSIMNRYQKATQVVRVR